MQTLLEEEVEKAKNDVLGSLKPEILSRLDETEAQFIRDLANFRAPYVKEKLMIEHKISSEREFMEAFTEFKKYVVLSRLYPNKRLAMPSRKVDEVWHQFILFTPQYHEFCEKFLGGYLHHVPKTSFTPGEPEDKNNFLRSYKETYGEVHRIWEPTYNNASCWSSEGCVTCCRT